MKPDLIAELNAALRAGDMAAVKTALIKLEKARKESQKKRPKK